MAPVPLTPVTLTTLPILKEVAVPIAPVPTTPLGTTESLVLVLTLFISPTPWTPVTAKLETLLIVPIAPVPTTPVGMAQEQQPPPVLLWRVTATI